MDSRTLDLWLIRSFVYSKMESLLSLKTWGLRVFWWNVLLYFSLVVCYCGRIKTLLPDLGIVESGIMIDLAP
jgi:hypothetical protein